VTTTQTHLAQVFVLGRIIYAQLRRTPFWLGIWVIEIAKIAIIAKIAGIEHHRLSSKVFATREVSGIRHS
jgi:hypothetical protein